MSKATAPSAPLPEFEGNEFQNHPPPPSYDQAMSSFPSAIADSHQGGHAPYPQSLFPSDVAVAHLPHNQPQHLPYPPTAAQLSYPPAAAQLPYPPASAQMPYPSAGQQMPYPSAGQQMPYPSAGQQMPFPPSGVPTEPPYPVQQPARFPSDAHSVPQANIPPPQPPAPQPTSVTTAVFVNGPVAVGPKPCRLRCPMCHSDIKTSTVTENQAGAHIACIILCLLGCFLCSCIPYCMDSCKIVQHKCPVCKSYLGTYKG